MKPESGPKTRNIVEMAKHATEGSGLSIRRSIDADEFRQIQPKVWAQVHRLGFSPEDADDLVQEAFLAAHQALVNGTFRGESELDTWIVGIVKNLALKRRRTQYTAKRHAPEIALDAPPRDDDSQPPPLTSSEPGPESQTLDRRTLAVVLQALYALPEALRSPLVLLAHGETYKEIAATLRIAPDLVTSRIYQARTRLRGVVPRPPRGSPD